MLGVNDLRLFLPLTDLKIRIETIYNASVTTNKIMKNLKLLQLLYRYDHL